MCIQNAEKLWKWRNGGNWLSKPHPRTDCFPAVTWTCGIKNIVWQQTHSIQRIFFTKTMRLNHENFMWISLHLKCRWPFSITLHFFSQQQRWHNHTRRRVFTLKAKPPKHVREWWFIGCNTYLYWLKLYWLMSLLVSLRLELNIILVSGFADTM